MAFLWGVPFGVGFSTNTVFWGVRAHGGVQRSGNEIKWALFPVLPSSKASVSIRVVCSLFPKETYDYPLLKSTCAVPFPHFSLSIRPPLALGAFEPNGKGAPFGRTKPQLLRLDGQSTSWNSALLRPLGSPAWLHMAVLPRASGMTIHLLSICLSLHLEDLVYIPCLIGRLF